jgi:hypothetical protein
MGDVYRFAMNVLAWLGSSRDDSHIALDLLKVIASKVEVINVYVRTGVVALAKEETD